MFVIGLYNQTNCDKGNKKGILEFKKESFEIYTIQIPLLFKICVLDSLFTIQSFQNML